MSSCEPWRFCSLAKGVSAPQISSVVPLTPQAIRKVGHRYQTGGLEPALYDKQRPGAATVLGDGQKQRIIAMVCSNPPEGGALGPVELDAPDGARVAVDGDAIGDAGVAAVNPADGRDPTAFFSAQPRRA